MGMLDKLFGSERKKETDAFTLRCPVDGVVIPLSGVEDDVFSKKILGDGCAIVPEVGEVYSPADGVIDSVFDTHHAISMSTACGAELLIHCGIDTVKMKGQGFVPLVRSGDKVKAGEPLLRFDLELIRKLGFSTTVPIIVLNSECFILNTVLHGQMTHGNAMIKLTQSIKGE